MFCDAYSKKKMFLVNLLFIFNLGKTAYNE